jgi:hypothetical protein
MRGLVVVMLVGLTIAVVSIGLAVWWVALMLRRLRCLTVRLLDRGTLTVRARLLPGTARRVAATQLQLHTGLDQTRRVLSDAARRNCPLGDLPGLFRRIEQLAASVDADLRMLDGDRDTLQRARLAEAVRRSEELTSMAAGIRRTVSGVHADMQLDGFGLLQRDLDVELRALRAGAGAARIS